MYEPRDGGGMHIFLHYLYFCISNYFILFFILLIHFLHFLKILEIFPYVAFLYLYCIFIFDRFKLFSKMEKKKSR